MSDDQNLDTVADALQADMAAHQRRFSGEVTADANQRLAAETVAQLEREMASSKAAPDPGPAMQMPIDTTPIRREINGERYVIKPEVENSQQSPLVRKASEAEHWFISHAMPRIHMLLEQRETGPLGAASWRDRVLAVFALKTQAQSAAASGRQDMARDLDKRYIFELTCILEASSIPFGDWKKDAPTKVTVSG